MCVPSGVVCSALYHDGCRSWQGGRIVRENTALVMSDSQQTIITRLRERLSTLKERL